MFQSTVILVGFFAIAGGHCISVPRAGTDRSTYFCMYQTAIQCRDSCMVGANIRVYSPPNDYPLRDDTIVFLMARAQLPSSPPALLDAMVMSPIPGDPEDEDYEKSCPDVRFPFLFTIGTSSGMLDTETVGDSSSRYFPIDAHERVRDENKPTTVTALLPSSPRWRKVPGPLPNTTLFFVGQCETFRNNHLTFSAEHVLYNLSSATNAPEYGTGKRRKFHAIATAADLQPPNMMSTITTLPTIPSASSSSTAGPSHTTTVSTGPVAGPARQGDGGTSLQSSPALESITLCSRHSSPMTPVPPQEEDADERAAPRKKAGKGKQRGV